MKTLLLAALLSALIVTPAHFAPAAGWHTRVGQAHACPGVPASRCVQVFSVASTTRWRDCLDCLPHRTVAAMRPADIAIQVNVARERKARAGPAWPPRVTCSKVVAGFEGLPGRVGTFQAYTRLGRREVSVFIVFGRSRPTDGQLQRANAELRRVRFG
jgi:hypothetical protein